MNLSADTTQNMENLWLEVKTDSSEAGGVNMLVYVGIAVVAALLVVVVMMNNKKKKRMAARRNASGR